MAKKKPSTDSERDGLVAEITESLGAVDLDGLRFIRDQLNVLRYNAEVEKLSENAREFASERAETAKNRVPFTVSVEQREGKFFTIVLDDTRVFFNLDEMRTITRICHAADDARDGADRLYRWFSRERKDLLIDADIASARSPYIANIYTVVRNTFVTK
ncbi:MAG: hypothetical protein EA426_09680 [Spirochaetaceae bacterium]|nr:MAG: hypothetical protein EA426_09680 [Spirochaetaceae bacterium]